MAEGVALELPKEWLMESRRDGRRMAEGMVEGMSEGVALERPKEWPEDGRSSGLRMTEVVAVGWSKEWSKEWPKNGRRGDWGISVFGCVDAKQRLPRVGKSTSPETMEEESASMMAK